jgi:lipid-binding SYLF domain-containing protein
MMSSRFTLGGEGEVAAGPVGRDATAQTDLQMRAEILSYSRSRGVFAGISLQGATIREDDDANQALYGQKLTSKEILTGARKAPAGAVPLLNALSKYSSRAGKR